MVDFASLFGAGVVRGGCGGDVGLHIVSRHGSLGCIDAVADSAVALREYSAGVYALDDGIATDVPMESAVMVVVSTKSLLIEILISRNVRIVASHVSRQFGLPTRMLRLETDVASDFDFDQIGAATERSRNDQPVQRQTSTADFWSNGARAIFFYRPAHQFWHVSIGGTLETRQREKRKRIRARNSRVRVSVMTLVVMTSVAFMTRLAFDAAIICRCATAPLT